MTQDGDDLLDFLDDAPGSTPAPRNGRPPWKVLVVDDDPDVHESTAFALRGLEIEGRALHLLHASSGTGCIATLRSEEDVAVVLLDV
ncbi:MAG: response regulator receiver protein, partial [Thauera propionica]|nr:response regulator receiver protein [Thauera propionica]